MADDTQVITDSNQQRGIPVVLWFSIASGLMLVGFSFFELIIFDALWVLAIFLLLIILAFFLASFIWSVVHVCRRKRFKTFKGFVPLLTQVIAIIVVLYVPLGSIARNLDFRMKLQKRTEVINMIRSAELECPKAYGFYDIKLPLAYRYLSKRSGTIEVERGYQDALYVKFFTYMGIPDGYQGIMYRSDDTVPETRDYRKILYFEKLMEHWYWIIGDP
jgi:hypothetical protein